MCCLRPVASHRVGPGRWCARFAGASLFACDTASAPEHFPLPLTPQKAEPWVSHKAGDLARAATIVTYAAGLARLLVSVFDPFMPGFADKVAYQLNVDVGLIPDGA